MAHMRPLSSSNDSVSLKFYVYDNGVSTVSLSILQTPM